MKKVLVLVFSDLQYDARVSRQVEWLQEKYQVTLASYGRGDKELGFIQLRPTPLPFLRKIKLAVYLLIRRFMSAYWLLYPYKKEFSKQKIKPDLIIANDIETIPLAFYLSELNNASTPVFFDAHEYAPRHFEDKLWFRIFFQPFNTFLCKKYLKKVTGMSTVSPGLVNEYRKNFSVDPVLLLNAPDYREFEPAKTKFPVRIIHHGGATISRKIENMIKMMAHLDDNYHLDLMLLVPPRASHQTRSYIDKLKALAKNDSRINFREPVKSNEVVDFIKDYDMGLFLLEPVNFNYKHTVPNKLLEFIQARLAVAIGPSPDMKTIVEEYNCGVVSKDFSPEALADEIKRLTNEDIDEFKNNSSKAAKVFNSENYRSVLLNEMERILDR